MLKQSSACAAHASNPSYSTTLHKWDPATARQVLGWFRPATLKAGNLWEWADLRPAPERVTLRALNAGLGTTGTHEAHRRFCALGMASIHWTGHCNIHSNRTLEAMRRVVRAYQMPATCKSGSGRPACRRRAWRAAFARDVLYLITDGGVQALSDVPYANIAPELLAVAPSVQVFHTLREPYAWAEKRILSHAAQDIVCRNLSVSYSLGACVEGEGSMSSVVWQDKHLLRYLLNASRTIFRHPAYTEAPDSPVSVRAFTDSWAAHNLFANIFVAHNARIAATMPVAQYSQQCLWDADFDAATAFAVRQPLQGTRAKRKS